MRHKSCSDIHIEPQETSLKIRFVSTVMLICKQKQTAKLPVPGIAPEINVRSGYFGKAPAQDGRLNIRVRDQS